MLSMSDALPPQSNNEREKEDVSNKTLYIYPTSERLYEEHLKEIFGLFGSISDLIYTKEEKYAKIIFENEDEAIKASAVMDGGIVDGKNVSVTFYRDFEKYREKMRKNRNTPNELSRGGRRIRGGRIAPNVKLSGRARDMSRRIDVNRNSRKSPIRGRFERERRYEETRRRHPTPSPSPPPRRRTNISNDKARHTKKRTSSSEESSRRSPHSRRRSSRKLSHKRHRSSSSDSSSL